MICFKDKIYTKNANCIKIWNNVYSHTKYIKDITYGEIWYKKPWKMMQKIIINQVWESKSYFSSWMRIHWPNKVLLISIFTPEKPSYCHDNCLIILTLMTTIPGHWSILLYLFSGLVKLEYLCCCQWLHPKAILDVKRNHNLFPAILYGPV